MAKNKYAVPKAAITERGLKNLLKKAAKEHSSVSEWCKEYGITPQVVSAFMRKIQGAGLQIPEALGYRPQTVYLPLDEEMISTMNPPRRPAMRPSKKVDHTREPINRAGLVRPDSKEQARKMLKARKAAR